ncbi:hypothetical protein TNCV_2397051 [Trichonephila clavipes]|uniref:Uncharacterized protein n=1 Tax=Trichonephila clavipes TaxID=2585209 RepID=A0A8X6SVK0_TRICX|nr:hypothetical protein TNCV_2397051 [Trichonephila clavipes]
MDRVIDPVSCEAQPTRLDCVTTSMPRISGGGLDAAELLLSLHSSRSSIHKNIEIHLSGFEATCYDPSRSPITRSAPKLLTSTIPGGFYDEYCSLNARTPSRCSFFLKLGFWKIHRWLSFALGKTSYTSRCTQMTTIDKYFKTDA